MSQKHEGWGWMLAVDFFFAGMGGAMLVIAGIADLFVGEGRTSALASFLGAAFMGLGSGLLIFELGRPFQSWRVFMNPKAILTVGAWVMSLAICAGLVYTTFSFAIFPWSGWVLVRKLLALVMVVSGLIVATYPGILLGRLKGRPLWVGPGMTSLFLTSSLVTAFAAHILSGMIVAPATIGDVLSRFPAITAVLLAVQLLLWVSYMWVKISGATEAEAVAARRLLCGEYSSSFKYGLMLVGTVLPLVLVLVSSPLYQATGAVLVLVGGFILRMLVIYAGGADRTWLPGEVKYRSRLPHGDEAFMKAWNSK
ncbi:MAG: NrfD/PsrC family molybdoenzyme membrane anchor subunit [Sporomusaceae bacterium]|nr:NrfD/PsrC family molybdoenzyme membrane anchor subunit [Sporomusaceae bacterium]